MEDKIMEDKIMEDKIMEDKIMEDKIMEEIRRDIAGIKQTIYENRVEIKDSVVSARKDIIDIKLDVKENIMSIRKDILDVKDNIRFDIIDIKKDILRITDEINIDIKTELKLLNHIVRGNGAMGLSSRVYLLWYAGWGIISVVGIILSIYLTSLIGNEAKNNPPNQIEITQPK